VAGSSLLQSADQLPEIARETDEASGGVSVGNNAGVRRRGEVL